MENTRAEATLKDGSHVLNRIEVQKHLPLTYDQGWEMAEHQQRAQATGAKVYFRRSP